MVTMNNIFVLDNGEVFFGCFGKLFLKKIRNPKEILIPTVRLLSEFFIISMLFFSTNRPCEYEREYGVGKNARGYF